ncbi:MAG: hypothetical protein GX575_30210 [Candidatus Anammoximicrobium sp.]|nr:hypothetical protein [Candidatus Anammoximicrobium sp.]
MKRITRIVLTAWLLTTLGVPPVSGQTELGTVLKKHYQLRYVSCYSCHTKEADEEAEKTKDKLTSFGEVIVNLVAGQQITERLNAVKGLEEEKEEVKDAIKREFAEALKKLDAVKGPNGKTYGELIQAGEIDGIRPCK